jgi:NitT/TauT family transport system substrate-binding protein
MLASPVTALTASAQGLDVRIVSGTTQNDPEIVEDSTAVVVGAVSDIQSARDLEGKTVSVNALGSIGEIGIREAVALDGGDPGAVNFVQLSFPEVAAQIEAGQIDAGMAGSPFMQQVVGAGGRVVSDFIHDTGLGENELVTVAGGRLVDEDPALVERFRAAMDEAAPFLDENKDLIREAMPEVLGTDPAVAEKASLSIYSSDIDEKTIQLFADLMYRYKVVDSEPDVSAVIWAP